MGLTYRNMWTSCLNLARLCAQLSHDALRRVRYRSLPSDSCAPVKDAGPKGGGERKPCPQGL